MERVVDESRDVHGVRVWIYFRYCARIIFNVILCV